MSGSGGGGFASSRRLRPSGNTSGGGGGGRAPRSHVQTEQRRRDRINEGFNHLRELIPNKEKLDKAAFLMSTMDYIKQLQVLRLVMACVCTRHYGACSVWCWCVISRSISPILHEMARLSM